MGLASYLCYGIVMNEWKSKYYKYLKSEEWQTFRLQILERDEGICQRCKYRKATCVHHMSYQTYNTEGYTKPEEVISLCRMCHAIIHGKVD